MESRFVFGKVHLESISQQQQIPTRKFRNVTVCDYCVCLCEATEKIPGMPCHSYLACPHAYTIRTPASFTSQTRAPPPLSHTVPMPRAKRRGYDLHEGRLICYSGPSRVSGRRSQRVAWCVRRHRGGCSEQCLGHRRGVGTSWPEGTEQRWERRQLCKATGTEGVGSFRHACFLRVAARAWAAVTAE